MKLIETAVSHFSSKTVREIYVPEWETTLYAKPLSLEDKSKWVSRANGDNTDYMVYALIFGLVDDKGDSVFDIGDKVKLRRNVDPEIVGRLANFVLEVTAPTDEEREKN
jgi:hypothetical protein